MQLVSVIDPNQKAPGIYPLAFWCVFSGSWLIELSPNLTAEYYHNIVKQLCFTLFINGNG
jgi:hypothetical protein